MERGKGHSRAGGTPVQHAAEFSAWRGLRSWRTRRATQSAPRSLQPFQRRPPRSRARLQRPAGMKDANDLVLERDPPRGGAAGRRASGARLSLKTGASSAGVLGPEMCGVRTTWSSPQSGCSAGSGSVEKTSRTAPPDAALVAARDQRGLVHHRAAADVEEATRSASSPPARARPGGLVCVRQRQDGDTKSACPARARAPAAGRRARPSAHGASGAADADDTHAQRAAAAAIVAADVAEADDRTPLKSTL